MDLFVYVATHDTGFAPNPFHGYCTLATCKPRIRQRAQVGDWVVGLGSKRNLQEGKLIYAMQVQEKMSFDEYWGDPRFTKKKPKRTGRQESECGDNIYHTNTKTGDWIQKRGYHSLANGCPDLKKVKEDTSSSQVLISKQFTYYGSSAVDIPDNIMRYGDKPERFIGIRGHRRNFPTALKALMFEWLQGPALPQGIHGTPTNWERVEKRSC